MKKKSLSRQAKANLDQKIRHRINAGRSAIKNEIVFFGRHFSQVGSDWKLDQSRVTFADIAISENIIEHLQNDFSQDDFWSEETNDNESVLNLSGEFAWVLDPIDGTNNFALGFPLCAISLALLHKGIPIYGFVYDFSVGALCEGGAGFGLKINEKLHVPLENTMVREYMIGIQFPMKKNLLDQIIPLLEKYKVRSIGSSTLIGTLVSKGYLWGALDTRCKVWDFAASYALNNATQRKTYFLEKNPFPLNEFHLDLPKFPYFCGEAGFCKEVKRLLDL